LADRERFNQLLSTHKAALIRLAGSYTKTAGDRDDLFQDIALAIWQALSRLGEFRAYFHVSRRAQSGDDMAGPSVDR